MSTKPELPKLSAFTRILATPEVQMEEVLKSSGITVPPGPMSMLATLQEQFETGLPELPSPSEQALGILSRLPILPPIETKPAKPITTQVTAPPPPPPQEYLEGRLY